ncbi:MAG: PLP-dependent aminotransferase family protein [Oscillospiraceae bacterium]|nr:PLP-dependent aminotransferase family protein [Oscillospiraceae bacterium]
MHYVFSNKMEGMKPSAIREIFKSLTDPTIISFAAGNPSPESFPTKQLGELSAKIFSDPALSNTALQYSITEGYPRLREQVAARLRDKFSIGREFDSTIITSGGQQGLDLACKVLCNENDVVICENPSFIGALNAFRANGAKLIGLNSGDDGIDPEKLDKTLENEKRVKLIYLIPTFQNPSGITTSLEKRKAIYEIAKKHGVMIMEDNPYGELRFAGEEIPTIKSFDDEGIVIYSGSFSKILSAGMRVGFLCAPEQVISKIVVAKQVNDVHTNIFFQMLCSMFIDEYDLDGHIASIKRLYGHKCALMLSEMDKSFPETVTYTRPCGGIFIWCAIKTNPDGTPCADSTEFVKAAIKNKVAVVPGATFNADQALPSNGFRLNYSTPADEQIVKGIGLLAELLNSGR